MEKKVYSDFKKKIEKLRSVVVEINGALEGISHVKKLKKTPKEKNNSPIIVSNVIEKE